MKQANRVVVVAGGANGIGLATAIQFARDGAHVVILGRNEQRLADAARKIGDTATTISVDLRRRSEIAAAAERIARDHGKVDVLVYAAGILKDLSSTFDLEQAEAVWDEVVDSNLKGALLTTVALAPIITSPGGRIINVGSVVAQSGGSSVGYLAYTPAKAGMHGLTLALAKELAARQITVNTVAPGFTGGTGMTGDWEEERVRRVIEQIPLGRAGTSDDVANAIHWLASDQAAYITGQTVSVNGGWHFK